MSWEETYVIDIEAAVVDDESRDCLGSQLGPRRDSANVIEKSNHKKNRARNYQRLAEMAKRDQKITESHSVEEAEARHTFKEDRRKARHSKDLTKPPRSTPQTS